MVIRKLRKIERGTVIMWGAYMQLWDELPLLNQSTIESTGSPAAKGEEAPSEDQVQQWRNESAFNARCLQSGAGSWDNYAMRALASALESDDWPAPHLRCEILAATQWLIYSSPTLIRWAKENDEDFAQGEVVNWERDVQPGPLFHGREGLSVGRWNFWKERLESLLQSPPDHLFVEDVHGSMSLALERMKIAEKEDAERPEDVESGEVGIPNESGD
ncbi:hypothetical protein Sste5346_009196 [Sporothrix stenoceras]|uniref:Uncharacterized protein n=1 Tax=Sporothrix stenoceras TaxID=5173 RepID=A0ABR3YMH9_9PEZI